ncbi:hypothetical protein H4R20_000733 [Coemansia guatemalensis]|uniref:C3H1-type domain-containing protein n=1 Tax=Coemansia guatemalensis TaxID=2761395 RepID=A0A9W8LV73_9FUNG|nr:hypothetical protein H4R20_000733 [Coemansia guatemalensis]
MQGGSDSKKTPAIYTDVTRDNIEALAADIRVQISRAKFIAVDTEFTGLNISNASPVFRFNNAEWVTRAVDMRERYKAMTNVAKTHALVSMGLSAFSRRHTYPGSYNVHSFNFMLQAQNTHLVNPISMAFLAQNGFDLGKQATKGIRYFSGPNPTPVQVKTLEINTEGALIREIFFEIVRSRRPLVIHNGLFDLVYLYQSFFGPLPDTYESFVYDLFEAFPGGIYDTKVIAENLVPGTASYLAYLYHKNERIQTMRQRAGDSAVQAKPKLLAFREVSAQEFVAQPSDSSKKLYCESFAMHGHCRLKTLCPLSHDIEFILDCQEKEQEEKEAGTEAASTGNGDLDTSQRSKQSGTSKRKNGDSLDDVDLRPNKMIKALEISKSESDAANANEKPVPAPKPQSEPDSTDQAMYHTAAYDAFMTGYIFASYTVLFGDMLEKHKNKIYRMGKPSEPLLVQASPYSTNSTTYRQTMPLVEQGTQTMLPDTAVAAAAAATEGSSSTDDSSDSESSDSSDSSSSDSDSQGD